MALSMSVYPKKSNNWGGGGEIRERDREDYKMIPLAIIACDNGSLSDALLLHTRMIRFVQIGHNKGFISVYLSQKL